MYLSSFHIFTIFAGFVIYIFAQYLLYYFFKEKIKLYTFSFTLFVFMMILTYSILLTLDGVLKKSELRNVDDYKSQNNVIIQGQIYNNGKVPLKTCNLNVRIINLNVKKVDGSIFDTSKHTSIFKLKKLQNSYSYDFEIDGIISENTAKTFRVNVPYPKHFTDYKLRYNLSCK